MPSPFPGMDPFIENQEWEDFHVAFITNIRALLVHRLRPRYVVRVERRVYMERSCAPPIPEEMREVFLTVRERGSMEVITVIELLSPTNKRPGADGYRKYRAKRAAVLNSAAHLDELDLLRGGQRLPTVEGLPAGDYYAIVSRRSERPIARIYSWTLRDFLPTISIPLMGDDPDVPLDLQAAFTTAYERARYDGSLDYSLALAPPLSDEDATGMRDELAARGSALSRPPQPNDLE